MAAAIANSEPTSPTMLAVPRGRPIPGLRRVRNRLLMTQEEFAAKVGLNRSNLAMIERGKYADYSTIKRLAEILGVEAEELLSADDAPGGV